MSNNRFLLESQHIDDLKAAQADSVLSDRALKLYANLDFAVIQEALEVAANHLGTKTPR